MKSWGLFVASAVAVAAVPSFLAQGVPTSASTPRLVEGTLLQARPGTNIPPECPATVNCTALRAPVMVSLVLGTDGYVERATCLSGPEALRAAALFAARQWRYMPYRVNGSAVRVETIVTVNFGPENQPPEGRGALAGIERGPERQKKVVTVGSPAAASSSAANSLGAGIAPAPGMAASQWRTPAAMNKPASGDYKSSNLPLPSQGGDKGNRIPDAEVGHDGPQHGTPVWRLLRQVPPVYPMEAEASGIQGIVQLEGIIQGDGVLEQVHVLNGPPELRQAAVDAAAQYQYVPVVSNGRRSETSTSFAIEFSLRGPAHVAPEVMAGLIEQSPRPEYPVSAVAAGVHGAMRLHVLIGRDGEVVKASVLSGPPSLRDSALEAIKQWRYKPYLRNGAHVEVDTTVLVTFVLPQE